jgi:hypothetical protein
MSNIPDVSEKVDALASVASARSNRRRFLSQVGLAGLGALAAGQVAMPAASAQVEAQANGNSDRIDTFLGPRNRRGSQQTWPAYRSERRRHSELALNLEYLEAEFYLRAGLRQRSEQ